MEVSILVHIGLILFVIGSAYMTYGAWCKDLARKNYEYTRRLFPSFLLWPKDLRAYTLVFRMLALIVLVASVALYGQFVLFALSKAS